LAEVSVASEPAVMVDALVTRMLFPALSVRGLAPPDEIVPAPAKPKAVAETDIVSIESTPVRSPPVVTLRPVEESANVPVAFPMAVSDPAEEERVVFPQDDRSVKIAVPGEEVPIDARFAAPVAEIFQSASVRLILADVFPRVRFPVYEPVPIFIAEEPVVLALITPERLAPCVAVNSPPKVTLSQSVPVVNVCVPLSLDQ